MTETKKYILSECLLDIYLPKSLYFLYPLLEIKSKIKPLATFVKWVDHVDYKDAKLVCGYNLLDSYEFKMFEKNVLQQHSLFTDFYELDTNINTRKGVYIFDLSKYKSDFESFLKGDYSEFAEKTKQLILDQYTNESEKEYMDSYLNPIQYYSIYAKHVGMDERDFWDMASELCPPFDRKKETLIAKIVQPKF